MTGLRANLPLRLAAFAVLGLAQLLLGTAQVWHHHHDDPSHCVPDHCAVCHVVTQPNISDPGPVITVPAPAVVGELAVITRETPAGTPAPVAVARGPPSA